MKIKEKYNVSLNDYVYNYAQYDFGTLREVLCGSAAIWRSHDDDDYYTLDPKVVEFYDDLEDAITNLEELQNVLNDVHWETYGDPEQKVSDWIYERFYFVFDDADEMIRRFARWDDARKSFIEMIMMEAIADKTYEPLLDEFVRNIF